jgi:A/G-specific adenine glycosylase
MLQQTQVNTVIPYFKSFISAFPTINELANSELTHVLKQWEGLGYYSRARNLHKGANFIVKKWGGNLPETYNELLNIPGVGDYTASAIMSIIHEHPLPVVDGNVLRVFARFWGIKEEIRNQKLKRVFSKSTLCPLFLIKQ